MAGHECDDVVSGRSSSTLSYVIFAAIRPRASIGNQEIAELVRVMPGVPDESLGALRQGPSQPTRLQTALAYAAGLHAGQTRKGGEEIPYIAHLLGVCSLTLEAGGDEDQAIAALLHDAAEDQGGRETLEEIRGGFGDRVASIVEACTDTFEDPKPAWRRRKERYLEHLESVPPEALLVACADKLYNARAILQDHRRLGDEVFERFRPGKEATLWYYRSVAEALSSSDLESWLVDELALAVAELDRAAREA